MKNSIILIYLVFTGFISFNNYITTERTNQSSIKYQNFDDNCSNCGFELVLPEGKQNHKLSHHENIKSGIAYLDDVSNINKLFDFPVYKIFTYKHLIIRKRINSYHMEMFLPIFTQTDKTIQSEFLII